VFDVFFTPSSQRLEPPVKPGRFKGKVYEEADFNRIIEIKAREAKRVQVFLDEINQNEKTIVFCANQAHAAVVRDLINQYISFHSITDATEVLGGVNEIRNLFIGFQKHLY